MSSITIPAGTIDLTQIRQQMIRSFELQQLVEKENIQLKQQVQKLIQTNIDVENNTNSVASSSSLSEEQIHQLIQTNHYLQDSVKTLKSNFNNLKSDYHKYTKTTLSDYTTLKLKFTQFIILIKKLETEKSELNTVYNKFKKGNEIALLNNKNDQNKQNQLIEKLLKENSDLQNINKSASETDTKYNALQTEYDLLNKKYNDLLPKLESARGESNHLKTRLLDYEQTSRDGSEQIESPRKLHSTVINN